MTGDEVVRRIIKVLHQVQEWSGKPRVTIGADTKPIGGLPGFDSLNGVEVTTMICDEFKFDFPRPNIFVNDAGNRARTVSQVAKCVRSVLSC
jgi:acyl carrier protein